MASSSSIRVTLATGLDRALASMSDRPWKPLCWRVSRAWVAAGMLYTLLVNLGVRHELWGPSSARWSWVREDSTADLLVADFPGVAAVHLDETLFELTYFVAIAAILLWLFRANLATTFVAGVSYALVIHGNFDIRDGSLFAVIHYCLASLLVVGVSGRSPGPLRILVHNAATVWITLQVSVIYLSSGLYKVVGEPWRQGVAMEGLLLDPSHSYSSLAITASSTMLGVGLTLSVVVLELLAPIAVFTRSPGVRRTIVLSLIAMHIGIVYVMGLIGFGFVMIGMATMMLRDSDLLWLRMGTSRLSQVASDRLALQKLPNLRNDSGT